MMGRQKRLSSTCCTSSRNTKPFHMNRESACKHPRIKHPVITITYYVKLQPYIGIHMCIFYYHYYYKYEYG